MEFKYRSLLTNFAYATFVSEMEDYNEIQDVGEMDGHLALKSHANSRNVFFASDKTCGCRFFKSMALPCRHIIYFLQNKAMDPFAVNLCHNRWLKKHLPADLVGDIQMATGSTVLSQMEKYRKVHEVTQKIAEMISEKPSAVFSTFFNALKQCEEAISENKIFAIEIINENGKHEINQFPRSSEHIELIAFVLHKNRAR